MKPGGTLFRPKNSHSRRRDEATILGKGPEPRLALSHVACVRGMPPRLALGRGDPPHPRGFSKGREPVLSFVAYHELQVQVKELQRRLRQKTLENAILKEAMEVARQGSDCCAHRHRR